MPTVRIARTGTRGSGKPITYALLDELAAVVWAANMAALELHVPQWTIDDHGDRRPPDRLVFDLDPGPGTTIVHCCRVAERLHDALTDDGLTPLAKTSGSKGMQLYCAISIDDPAAPSAYAKKLAQRLARETPYLVTAVMAKAQRTGRVFIDWSQNNPAKTTIAPYSLRGREHPTVSTPITWDEARTCRRPERLMFNADDILDRVDQHGDLSPTSVPHQQPCLSKAPLTVHLAQAKLHPAGRQPSTATRSRTETVAGLRRAPVASCSKAVRHDDLVHAVRVIAERNALSALSVTSRLISEFIAWTPAARVPVAELSTVFSARKREILELIAKPVSAITTNDEATHSPNCRYSTRCWMRSGQAELAGAGLGELVGKVRSAGVETRLVIDGDPEGVPAAAALIARRIAHMVPYSSIQQCLRASASMLSRTARICCPVSDGTSASMASVSSSRSSWTVKTSHAMSSS